MHYKKVILTSKEDSIFRHLTRGIITVEADYTCVLFFQIELQNYICNTEESYSDKEGVYSHFYDIINNDDLTEQIIQPV